MQESLYRCCVCQQTFFISQDESEILHLRDSAVGPSRHCDNCGLIMRSSRAARDNSIQVHCAQCGRSSKVPYSAKGYPSVYCSECIVKL